MDPEKRARSELLESKAVLDAIRTEAGYQQVDMGDGDRLESALVKARRKFMHAVDRWVEASNA